MEIYHQKKYWKLKHFTFTGSLSYNHNNCVPQESNKYGQKDIFKLLETRKLAEQLRWVEVRSQNRTITKIKYTESHNNDINI